LARVVKDPEERRIELLKTARDLFYELGYEQTSVQKITETVGIAKGTFYHYFHSKEDLLGQLADWQTEEVLTMAEHKVEKMGGNAVEKFRGLIENIISWKTENREMMITYIRVMFRDENFPLRNKLNQIYREKVYPLFSKVIRQGTEEGIFKVKDIEESSEIFLSMLLGWAERLAPITLSVFENPERISILIKKVKAFENAIERILGVKEGTLKIYDIDKIKKFFLEEG